MSLRGCLLALTLAAQAYSFTPCPLLGPTFEPAKNLADSSTLKDAFDDLRSTLQLSAETGVTEYGKWSPANTSWAIGVFDASSPGQLFSMQHTSESVKQSKRGVKKITENSIFRVGSISKLITAYLILIELGPKYWHRSVTEFVPKLKQAADNCRAQDDPIDCTDWHTITLGSLASHMSGIAREYSTFAEILSPLAAGPEQAVMLGLPPLPESAAPPCGLGAVGCPADLYLDGLIERHPGFPAWTTPSYSNSAFAVLGVALENITGRKMGDMLDEDLFGKLNMTGSSYSTAKSVDDSAIPAVAEDVFGANLDAINPAGGMFSTNADLTRMGQSILNAELLKPAVIRQWMKPVAFTSSITAGVGAPWEIYRVPSMTDHLFDLYTKAGDLVAYAAYIVISPDYDVGFVVNAAGDAATSTVEQLANTVTAELFPAIGNATQEEADAKYAGTYTASPFTMVNSSLTISTEPGKPGLVISGWITNGTSSALPLGTLLGAQGDVDVRLQPSGFVNKTADNCEQIGYWAVYDDTSRKPDGGVFDSICMSWIMGVGTYGNVGLAEYLFTVQDGKVVSIEPRAFRLVLEKDAEQQA